jgi:predicted small secreted protein
MAAVGPDVIRLDQTPTFHTSPGIPGGTTETGELDNTKDTGMYKNLIVGLTLLSLMAAMPLLSACHTAAGAGQDISATGKVIEKEADKHKP